MKAYVFPGQGAQFPGMGKDLYENFEKAKELFEAANDILGFRLTEIMFSNQSEEFNETSITQPAIFLHSVILTMVSNDFSPDMVAGHSLGEFSALCANKTLTFEDALNLVWIRANAMQKECEVNPSKMAAIIGLDDKIVEDTCSGIEEIVVAANYNCPGQLVISGSNKGVELAINELLNSGAKRAILLPVRGAFHSPLMEPVKAILSKAINETSFNTPNCPIYQNSTALPTSNVDEIKINLIDQLTEPVKWTHTIGNMIDDGATDFIESGPGRVLQGLIKKIDRKAEVRSI